MFEIRDEHYLGRFPDGIAGQNPNWLDEPSYSIEDVHRHFDVDIKQCCMASVKIKSVIAESTLNSAHPSETVDLIICWFGNDRFRKYVMSKLAEKLMPQKIVLNLTGLLYIPDRNEFLFMWF